MSNSVKNVPNSLEGMASKTTEASNLSASSQQAGVGRRATWLEEDVALLHRRLPGECGDALPGATGWDSDLRALVVQLGTEIVKERRLREALEARVGSLENLMQHERQERKSQMCNLSNDFESIMRDLLVRIKERFSVQDTAMREGTETSEGRLRDLIKRVDEGLSDGVVALQDSLRTIALRDDCSAASQVESQLSSSMSWAPDPRTAMVPNSLGVGATMPRNQGVRNSPREQKLLPRARSGSGFMSPGNASSPRLLSTHRPPMHVSGGGLATASARAFSPNLIRRGIPGLVAKPS